MERTHLVDVPLAGATPTGYVQRHGRPNRKGSRTSAVALTVEERELLERLAVQDDVLLSEVWRRALRHYAQLRGVLPAAGEEGVNVAA